MTVLQVEPHERDQGAGDENKIDVESTAVGEDEGWCCWRCVVHLFRCLQFAALNV